MSDRKKFLDFLKKVGSDEETLEQLWKGKIIIFLKLSYVRQNLLKGSRQCGRVG